MLLRFYRSYKIFFDEKIQNTTFVVIIISLIIALIPFLVDNSGYKRNFITSDKNIVTLEGKTYKIVFEEQ